MLSTALQRPESVSRTTQLPKQPRTQSIVVLLVWVHALFGYKHRLASRSVRLHAPFGYTRRLVTRAVWLHTLFGYTVTNRLVLQRPLGYTDRLTTRTPRTSLRSASHGTLCCFGSRGHRCNLMFFYDFRIFPMKI